MVSGVLEAKWKAKMHSDERVFVLEKIEGTDTKTNTGLVDNRLFKGETQLVASIDERSFLWGFKYEAGTLPQPLKQKFTSFKKLKDFAVGYFQRRGIKVVKVLD